MQWNKKKGHSRQGQNFVLFAVISGPNFSSDIKIVCTCWLKIGNVNLLGGLKVISRAIKYIES